MTRIGIYAGTFDPIHNGHLAFAAAALQQAQLDTVVLLPERIPRHKHGLTDYEHRVAMLELAMQHGMQVMRLGDDNFTVSQTLPELQQKFEGATLVFLVGSDVAPYIPDWPHSEALLETSELAIGLRQGVQVDEIVDVIRVWPVHAQAVHIVTDAQFANVSSTMIRSGASSDVPSEVLNFMRTNHLYNH